jgi:hypothetical protein
LTVLPTTLQKIQASTKGKKMSLSANFEFVEKEDVAFAIERACGKLFRMDGRSMSKWVEITHPDSYARIRSNASPISESEAMLLADELAEDLAGLEKRKSDPAGPATGGD